MKEKSGWRAWLGAATWMTLCAASPGAHADEIHVLATGALHGAFDQLVPMFEKSSGHRLAIAWGRRTARRPRPCRCACVTARRSTSAS